MRKIPTIFIRDPENRSRVTESPNPTCEWVFMGEGVATRKYDGTSCLINGEGYWKRRELKQGAEPPEGFVLADRDDSTGKAVGWVPVENTQENKWHIEAYSAHLPPGTYELCGPKIQANPENYSVHVLFPHGAEVIPDVPRTYEGIDKYLRGHDIEGIVFHHADGRMAKIKRRDYGMKRGELKAED